MNQAIDFYFDFSSPYAYFARHGVDAMSARTGREVVWRPMMIGSAMKVTGNTPLMSQPLKGPYCAQDWERLSRLYKIAWKLPDPFPIAALAPSRLFYWIEANKGHDLARHFAKAVFDAYYGKNIDISKQDATVDIAQLHGINPDEAMAVVNDPVWKDRLKEETEKAIARGVFGSPFFIVDQEPFWGFDRIPMMEEWIKQGGW